ncbi:hypothetical protein HN018_12120 [Lichenicola cladoniae]|uniref:DUF1772 domain-containing protein n=1 Tax=Lichenicola cladoniae TaxID=1484109 RepID=A0A6M8HR33_9PROT|nr:hypothetical protein [Lichenicola cladoniae]NPD68110.1 hypothetical protein [Acetobacteraceae bacterium]QKE90681.1 hypothetical protein HN018_12120 [Lichenicola cladoniae]
MIVHAVGLGGMLFFGGLWAGSNLMMLAERARTWQRMADEGYPDDFRRTMMLSKLWVEVTGLATAFSSGVFAITAGPSATVAIIATSITAFTLVASGMIDKPAPATMTAATGQAKPELRGHRAVWRGHHAGRTLAAVAAFLCLCTAACPTTAGWAMIVSGGLWTGGVSFLAVERSRAWRDMPLDDFLADFRVSVRFVDPLMPVCCFASAIAATVFSRASHGTSAIFGWVGVVCTMIAAVGSGAVSAPSVLRMLRSEKTQTSAQLMRDRTIMLASNVVRTIAALLAFVCLDAAIIAQ